MHVTAVGNSKMTIGSKIIESQLGPAQFGSLLNNAKQNIAQAVKDIQNRKVPNSQQFIAELQQMSQRLQLIGDGLMQSMPNIPQPMQYNKPTTTGNPLY